MLVPMRRHAGAVILLGGWLLMQPDIQRTQKFVPGTGSVSDPEGKYGIEATKDVRSWRQLGAFDTAQACEQVRLRQMMDLAQKQQKHPNAYPELERPLEPSQARFDTVEEASRFAGRFQRCVPSEAVYPPPTPQQQ